MPDLWGMQPTRKPQPCAKSSAGALFFFVRSNHKVESAYQWCEGCVCTAGHRAYCASVNRVVKHRADAINERRTCNIDRPIPLYDNDPFIVRNRIVWSRLRRLQLRDLYNLVYPFSQIYDFDVFFNVYSFAVFKQMAVSQMCHFWDFDIFENSSYWSFLKFWYFWICL